MGNENNVNPNPTITFEAETFRRIQPEEYLRKFVQQHVRPDGCITTADGSSMVRIGNTTIVCGIKAEVSEPKLNFPKEGYLVPNIDLSPICSPRFKPGPPSEQAQILSENLNKLLKNPKVIDLETLCIQEGKAAWVLFADIVCVNYDGNIFDACVMALISALADVKLPKAVYEDGLVKATEEKIIALSFIRTPYSISFAMFDGKHLLADPNEMEESIIKSAITIAIDETGQLCNIWKVGTSCTPEQLRTCISKARDRYVDITSIIEKARQAT
ncbi:12491_t:CDS:2 [Funneliformis geosporum]|uniref:Ribosomal RNA-processing protein 43 n=1 Tax=Funneliformis geosporum TaxID=1117311 RepID=A0A9W4SJK7_9GLOM|nr:10207_t:CDS:2 [Funneliformis geosporum]CAI2177750.1 12491_t:CDS:2 [Funneliformis geosporum]